MDFLQILHSVFLCFLPLLHSVNTLIIHNHNLIYTHCSNQTSPNPSHSALLPILFNQFISKSSKSNFFETIVADDHQNAAISGAFQCRNDLSRDECTKCVSKISHDFLSNDLCGKNTPARIQLSGCYAHYQDASKIETNPMPYDQIFHKDCGKRKIKRKRFEEMKYAAFASLEDCVMSGDGFCETKYESFRVLAQCGGSLRNCGCGECVSNAVQIAGDDECRFSVSGEIYLDSCFISYDYYGSGRFGTFTDEGNKSGKLMAIVVGGLVVLSMGLGMCYFITSRGKEDDW